LILHFKRKYFNHALFALEYSATRMTLPLQNAIYLILSLCTGILGIQTSLSCGVLAIRGHARHLVNCFSAFSDDDSLKGP
jgi:hypothetical protein